MALLWNQGTISGLGGMRLRRSYSWQDQRTSYIDSAQKHRNCKTEKTQSVDTHKVETLDALKTP